MHQLLSSVGLWANAGKMIHIFVVKSLGVGTYFVRSVIIRLNVWCYWHTPILSQVFLLSLFIYIIIFHVMIINNCFFINTKSHLRLTKSLMATPVVWGIECCWSKLLIALYRKPWFSMIVLQSVTFVLKVVSLKTVDYLLPFH